MTSNAELKSRLAKGRLDSHTGRRCNPFSFKPILLFSYYVYLVLLFYFRYSLKDQFFKDLGCSTEICRVSHTGFRETSGFPSTNLYGFFRKMWRTLLYIKSNFSFFRKCRWKGCLGKANLMKSFLFRK